MAAFSSDQRSLCSQLVEPYPCKLLEERIGQDGSMTRSLPGGLEKVGIEGYGHPSMLSIGVAGVCVHIIGERIMLDPNFGCAEDVGRIVSCRVDSPPNDGASQ